MELLLGALVGGVVLFVWGAIAWMGLPHHHHDTASLGAAEAGVSEALNAAPVKPGWYLFPHYTDYESMNDPKLKERMSAGPNGMLIAWPSGPPMNPGMFLAGLMINFCEALGAAAILWYSSERVDTLLERMIMLSGIGLLVRSAPLMLNIVWWKFPPRGMITTAIDGVVGLVLVAVALHFVLF